MVDLSANTTPHLVADIERLRVRLGIDRWLVCGGSWGVTLGLAYAQAHPDRVTELVLAAATSGERRETDWITRDAFHLAFARIVTHYWSHGSFLADGEILRNTDRIRDIPGVLIHGRYDVSGPLDTAWRLHNTWPGSTLIDATDFFVR